MKIKVLFFIHEPSYTGGPLLVLNLIKTIDYKKFEPVVVLLYAGPLKEEFLKIGVKVFAISKKKTSIEVAFFTHFVKILSLLQDLKPSIVHINSSVLYPVVLFSRFVKAKSLIHVHELINKRPGIFRRLALQSCDRLIFVSHASMRALEKHIRIKNYSVVHNGIAEEWYSDPIQPNEEKSTTRLTMIGLISPLKSQHLLIESFAKINIEEKNCVLNFIGEIKTRPRKYHRYFLKLQEIVSANKLTELVHFDGLVKDIKSELAKSDILVHTSKEESCPLSILEAMALGKPVVAFRVGGISELIMEGETGFLVEFGDTEMLKEKLLLLVRDRRLREIFGNNARKRAREFFDIKKMTREIEAVYQKLSDKNLKRN